MIMPNRNFRFSDDVLIQYSNNVLSYLEDDLADFAGFDPDLGEARRAAFATLVNWGPSEGGDVLNVAKLNHIPTPNHQ